MVSECQRGDERDPWLGGVMGVAVLASAFAGAGSYATPAAFTDGLLAALPIGAGVLACGAVAALFVPAARQAEAVRVAPVQAVTIAA